ncbi:MAG: S8 family serine peptidase [Planctomycetota bacterium]
MNAPENEFNRRSKKCNRSDKQDSWFKRRRIRFQQLETRRLLAADWQNPDVAFDVNDDNDITPLDALLVINELNRTGGRIDLLETSGLDRDYYPDVSGDGGLSALDALLVVNRLNQPAGEQIDAPAPNLEIAGVRALGGGNPISPDGNLSLILDLDNTGDPIPTGGNPVLGTAVIGSLRIVDMAGNVVATANDSTIFFDQNANNEILLTVSLAGLPEGTYDIVAVIDTNDDLDELSESDNTQTIFNSIQISNDGPEFDFNGFDPNPPPNNANVPPLFDLPGIRDFDFDDGDVELEVVVNEATLTITSLDVGTLQFTVPGFASLSVPIIEDLELEIGGFGNTLIFDNAIIPDDLEIELHGGNHRVLLDNILVGDDLEFDGSSGSDQLVIHGGSAIGGDILMDLGRGDDTVAIHDLDVGDDLRLESGSGDDLVALNDLVVADEVDIELEDDDDQLSAENVQAGDDVEFDGDDHFDRLGINVDTIFTDELDLDDFEELVNTIDIEDLIDGIFPSVDGTPVFQNGFSVDQGASTVNLLTGQSINLSYSVNVGEISNGPVNTTVQQTIDGPIDGLLIASDYPAGGFSNASAASNLVNQTFTAVTPGVYVVTTIATREDNQETAADTLMILIEDATAPTASLVAPGIDVPGIAPQDAITVTVTSELIGGDANLVELVQTTQNGDFQTLLGTLVDDGTGGDQIADDGIFGGDVEIPASMEGEVFLATRTTIDGETIISPVASLPVTGLKLGLGSNDSPIVSNADGDEWVEGQIIVGFNDMPTDERVTQIATQFNAEILGALPRLRLVLLDVPAGEFETALAGIAALEDVSFAELNILAELTTTAPDSSSEYGDRLVRAEEAAIVAQEGLPVVVLDTGVDRTHPDLSGRIVNGPDFVNGDSDSSDDQGHGTRVAGIIAAKRNGSGVTGLSSGQVIAVKVMPGASSKGSVSDVIEGFEYAANLGQRVVVNASLKVEFNSLVGQLIDFVGLSGLASSVKAVQDGGSLVVAAAGNDGESGAERPASYSGVLGVGASTASDTRWIGLVDSSNSGSGVDIAAPGAGVFSTTNGGGTGSRSGTSFAAPFVAAAAAVVWKQNPTWSAARVSNHLIATAVPLPGQNIGPRLDFFEAVFNGSFESDVEGWDQTGTVSTLSQLGSLTAQDRGRLVQVSTGPAGDGIAASLSQTFVAQPGATSVELEFVYAMLTEEFDEFVGTEFDDILTIQWIANGTSQELVRETVNTSSFAFLGGIDFPGGDNTLGWTGWKTITTSLPVTPGASCTLQIDITDTGDDIFDSVALIDGIRFKA